VTTELSIRKESNDAKIKNLAIERRGTNNREESGELAMQNSSSGKIFFIQRE
jgi:hypothetical protein